MIIFCVFIFNSFFFSSAIYPSFFLSNYTVQKSINMTTDQAAANLSIFPAQLQIITKLISSNN